MVRAVALVAQDRMTRPVLLLRFLTARRREFPTIGPGQKLSSARVEPSHVSMAFHDSPCDGPGRLRDPRALPDLCPWDSIGAFRAP